MQENKVHYPRSLVWFRRDLRNFDHAALYHALRQSDEVYCTFIFDKTILDNLPENDRRVAFIHESIIELDQELQQMGGGLLVCYAKAEAAIPQLVAELGVDAVFTNHDYEPQAVARDESIRQELLKRNCAFLSFKDQVIFEKSEVLSLANTPFSVFTPYKNAWLKKFHAEGSDFYSRSYPIEKYAHKLSTISAQTIPTLAEMGFCAGRGAPYASCCGHVGRTYFAGRLCRPHETV